MERIKYSKDHNKDMPEIDLSKIKEIGLRLAANAENQKKRDFVNKISIGKEPRIKILRGFRGVGKTTGMLQLLGEKSIYFSLDNPYIEQFQLYEIGKKIVSSGYTTILIDEIHYYKNWKRDTKALYDEFPNLNIVASGSAPLAFEPERRYQITEIEPLSLREFISLKEEGNVKALEFWDNEDEIIKYLAQNSEIYKNYEEYLLGGALPAYFSYGDKTLPSIYQSIKKSIKEDAVLLANADGEMTIAMERALIFIASSPLGEFSINNLSKLLEIKKHKAYALISLLESMKILRLVKPYAIGANLVRGEPKLMFYHPVFRRAVCEAIGIQFNKGAEREELAVFCLSMRGWTTNTIKGRKRTPDYLIQKKEKKIIIEVGGEGKNRKQLSGFDEKTLLIKDRNLIILSLF